MAKTKPKKTEDVANQAGMKLTDLSTQKRVELYSTERTKLLKELSDKYGIGETVQLSGYPRMIVPQLVPIDLLAKNPQQDESNQGQ